MLRVTTSHFPHGAGNHERDSGCRSDRELTRGAEQGVAEATEQITIDADLRGETGKPRIGERNRDRIGRKRNAGDDIAAQPWSTITRQPLCGREKPHQSTPACVRIRHARRFASEIGGSSGLRNRATIGTLIILPGQLAAVL